MIDEHTRLSVLNIVERFITSDRLVVDRGSEAFALWGGPPQVLRMDNAWSSFLPTVTKVPTGFRQVIPMFECAGLSVAEQAGWGQVIFLTGAPGRVRGR